MQEELTFAPKRDSSSNFIPFKIVGNYSKAREFDSIWTWRVTDSDQYKNLKKSWNQVGQWNITIERVPYQRQLRKLNRALKNLLGNSQLGSPSTPPSHSPDITSFDYHLFWSMPHGLFDQHFISYEDAKQNWVDSWIFPTQYP